MNFADGRRDDHVDAAVNKLPGRVTEQLRCCSVSGEDGADVGGAAVENNRGLGSSKSSGVGVALGTNLAKKEALR